MSKYIRYSMSGLVISGLGHSFTDYMACLLVSRIFGIPFIRTSRLRIDTRYTHRLAMRGTDKRNRFYWNKFLNLDELSKEAAPPHTKDLRIVHIRIEKHYKIFPFRELKEIIEKDYGEDVVFEFRRNTRIVPFDMYHYQTIGEIPDNTIESLFDELKNVYFQKHTPIEHDKIVLVHFIRKGDGNRVINDRFYSQLFEYMYNRIEQDGQLDKFIFKIVCWDTHRR